MNLKQLSEMLGLSQTTVSRALNGYPEVNRETRERVVAAARKHHYAPSRAAHGLATGRVQVVGHVVPQADHMMINPHFADFIAGAGEVYALRGYEMLISVVSQEKELAAYRRLAAERRVDGLIIHGPLMDDPRLPLLDEIAVPYVVHGRSESAVGDYTWVDVNNRGAFDEAIRFLAGLGHSRIALLNGLEHMNFAARRKLGYLDGLASVGIDVDVEIMHATEMIEPNGYELAGRMMASDNPPTAYLCSSVLLAMGVLRAVRENGLSVPDDVSIVTFDDELSFLQNSGAKPLFTAVRSSIREAGKIAANLVIDRIEDPEKPHSTRLLSADLVFGASTPEIGGGTVPNIDAAGQSLPGAGRAAE